MDGRPRTDGPLRILIHHRAARRVACAFALFNGAELGAWLALMIYAFDQGGPSEAGVVAVTQLVPAGVLAPIAGGLAERYRPDRVLAIGYWTQGGALAVAAAILAAGGPAILVYVSVGVMTVAVSTTRPAQALVTPRLARHVDELTALNVVAEWATQGALFVSPAIAGVLLGLAGPELVFAVFAGTLMVAAMAVPRLDRPDPAMRPDAAWTRTSPLATASYDLRAAVRVTAREPAVRLVLVIAAAGFVVVGALDVLLVVLAVDGLHGSASTAAWLTATLGLGGVVGGATGSALVGRRLAPTLVLAAFELGAALVAIGLTQERIVVFVMLFAAGLGEAVGAITVNSLLQRCAPSESVGHAFAVRECLFCLGLATGSFVAPLLIDAVDLDGAFLVVGALVPFVVVLQLGAVWHLDRSATVPIVELTLLRGLVLFRALPGPALEGLARNATPVEFAPGAVMMRQGEPGEAYFAVVDGSVAVVRDGRTVAVHRRGDGVGETALIRAVPRTATVRALEPVRALSITKDEFLVAVTGHPATNAAATALADRRIAQGRHGR